MSLWTWIIPLQLLAFAFLIAEVFIPSAGLLVALMFGSAGLSIWLSFEASRMAGLIVLGTDLLLFPIAAWYALSKVPTTAAALRDQLEGKAVDNSLEAYIGQVGVCETDLRPVGRVRVGDQIVEAQAPHGFLAKGSSVRIERIEGGHLFVEPT